MTLQAQAWVLPPMGEKGFFAVPLERAKASYVACRSQCHTGYHKELASVHLVKRDELQFSMEEIAELLTF